MATPSTTAFPRVLIVSHNPFSDVHNNGKLFSTLFAGWDVEKLAQLYLTTDVPSFAHCRKYFQLNDFDMVKRVVSNRNVEGREVVPSDLPAMQAYKRKVSANPVLAVVRRYMSPLIYLLKDLLWNLAGYKTRELKRFVDHFNPDVVVFHSYADIFAFSLARWICRRRGVPLIMLTTDDYLSGKFTLDPFFWAQQFRVRRAYARTASFSDQILVVSDQMRREYSVRFEGSYQVLTNATTVDSMPLPTRADRSVQLLYAGNWGLNRWKVLSLISESLVELDREEGLAGELSIYSITAPTGSVLRALNNPPYSAFKGALNADELFRAKMNSDVLVHVEAFDRDSRRMTRLSMSTKIPEYLAAGRCVLAVGPSDVASMQYLAEYDLAVVVTSNDGHDIRSALRTVLADRALRSAYGEKGLAAARLRHDASAVADRMFHIVTATVSRGIAEPPKHAAAS